ncbi:MULTISPECIES: DUF1450 domain-containing protein [Cytobacillus]|uniref:DUF1450 domain-containing protein n=1 Tax=Cytobacillus stercorigallinarum TaxID=2762240 RepID=A0ABR8QQF7_9BACI|nr:MULTISPECIES: DUF1450 domain-containing protein [Cytobacillus]MBD7937774.1 DUF1450 domain-containing protein [Cytobacillus stercorigallinarum]MCM3321160.1 YuzB family protein [Cytobacillus kochii]MCM3344007.1 YuzB family protein [Cytobacillus kochii]
MGLFNKIFSKKEQVTIEFCEKNLDRFYTDEDFALFGPFLSSKEVSYKQYECQSHCKQCKKSPYAIVNGEFIQCETPSELLSQMKEQK